MINKNTNNSTAKVLIDSLTTTIFKSQQIARHAMKRRGTVITGHSPTLIKAVTALPSSNFI